MSSCSFEQDEHLARQFRRTPGTPMKAVNQTPRRSSRKRCLFQQTSPLSSPEKSDDLGPMSPLSASSDDSFLSNGSPCFSPNGKFSTPPKTPVRNASGPHERVSTRKIEITTSLFPNLKLNTSKSHRKPCTPRRSERLTPKRSDKTEDVLRVLTTPPKSSKKGDKSEANETESDSSQNMCYSTPRRSRQSLNHVNHTPVTKFGIKTISCDSFYGPARPASKVRTQLFIDSIGSKVEAKKRARSLSVDSISSNRSFVSGCQKKNKPSETYTRPKTSKRSRQRGPLAGVWHGVKKPKKMKPAKTTSKHFISPKSRVAKMLEGSKAKPIQVKPKRLFEEKPRRRIARRSKKTPDGDNDNDIIDPFPHHLIKRKRLPTLSHPSNDDSVEKEDASPDPNKKFMKYGTRRKATFTLNANLTLQFSDGVMKLQSPKKRRKLYSGKNELFFDFCDDDEKNSNVKENIENILSKLDSEKDEENAQKGRITTPVKVRKMTEDQLLNILDSPRTKIRLVNVTPSKVLTEIQNDPGNKLLANLSSLAIKGCPDEETYRHDSVKVQITSAVNGELSLEKTGSLLSSARNILANDDATLDAYPLSEDEALDEKNSKFYSLFYKENWNNAVACKELTNKSSAKKKAMKVPDDQYLLDAGQKSIGIVTCNKCGVMYQAGDYADEATHKNFHEHLPELRFTGWTNERVVGRYLDGRVIMIVSVDPKAWWHKVTKIVDIVDQELGFAEGSVTALVYKTVYLFINDKAKQIVGCLIAEECKEAYKMFPPLEGVDVDSCSKEPSPCKVGISRIWTALNHRRRGVAKRMIDCLRRTFIFGEILPMDMIAFSVPSPSGKLLAQNVTGKMDFLVYGFA